MVKKEKESSGFPIDDMIEDTSLEDSEMDEWERKEREKRKKVARLMARAILKGSLDEDGIYGTISGLRTCCTTFFILPSSIFSS